MTAPLPVAQANPLLSIRELRTVFPTGAGLARAVDGLTLGVEPGETLGIVGESGSGKTVTALSILGSSAHPAASKPAVRSLSAEWISRPVMPRVSVRSAAAASVWCFRSP